MLTIRNSLTTKPPEPPRRPKSPTRKAPTLANRLPPLPPAAPQSTHFQGQSIHARRVSVSQPGSPQVAAGDDDIPGPPTDEMHPDDRARLQQLELEREQAEARCQSQLGTQNRSLTPGQQRRLDRLADAGHTLSEIWPAAKSSVDWNRALPISVTQSSFEVEISFSYGRVLDLCLGLEFRNLNDHDLSLFADVVLDMSLYRMDERLVPDARIVPFLKEVANHFYFLATGAHEVRQAPTRDPKLIDVIGCTRASLYYNEALDLAEARGLLFAANWDPAYKARIPLTVNGDRLTNAECQQLLKGDFYEWGWLMGLKLAARQAVVPLVREKVSDAVFGPGQDKLGLAGHREGIADLIAQYSVPAPVKP